MTKQRRRARVVLLVTGILAVVVVAAVVQYRDELVAWYEFRRDFEGLGKNAQGRPEYRHRETGIVFVGLPGGTFDMGSPDGEANRQRTEGPVHKVTLSPFLIAKYEVSRAEWQKVTGNIPSESGGGVSLPVDKVSWEDCRGFCEKTGLSLPTEAQWEYACRAGTSGPFAGTGRLEEMGWFIDILLRTSWPSPLLTHPAGKKYPNAFGIHDMHGNVWEWCEDWRQEDFYQESTGARDPLCENSDSGFRVIRGGGLVVPARFCRSAQRGAMAPVTRDKFLGFRPAWSSP